MLKASLLFASFSALLTASSCAAFSPQDPASPRPQAPAPAARPPEVGKPDTKTEEAMQTRKAAFGEGKKSDAGQRADVHVPHVEPPHPGADAPPRPRDVAERNDEAADLLDAERSIYRPTVTRRDFATTMRDDVAAIEGVMARQQLLLQTRYDLANRPRAGVLMSGGRKAVQEGIRVKLAGGSWDELAAMSPEQIKAADLFPGGFRSLPHVKHEVGGQVFPDEQIAAIRRQEARELQRFDTKFDLPAHFTPEFPPPIFLQNHPELGDVSQGQLLTIKNYFAIMNGKLTPVCATGHMGNSSVRAHG